MNKQNVSIAEECAALCIQRFCCKTFFYKNLQACFDYLSFENEKNLDIFMKKINTKKGLILAGRTLRLLYRLAYGENKKITVKMIKEFLLLLMFYKFPNYFHYIHNETDDKKNTALQKSLHHTSTRFTSILKALLGIKVKSFYLLRQYSLQAVHCITQFKTDLEKWKEFDKLHLIQSVVDSYFSLLELEKELHEKIKNPKLKEKELLAAQETIRGIVIQKETMRRNLVSIEPKAENLLDELVEQTNKWENSIVHIEEQIKTQMKKSYWDSIDETIQINDYSLVLQDLEVFIEKLKAIVPNSNQFQDRIKEMFDFSYIRYRISQNNENAKYIVHLFKMCILFLQELDSIQNESKYDEIIKQLETSKCMNSLLDSCKVVYPFLDEKLNEVFKSANLVRNLPLFKEWKNSN